MKQIRKSFFVFAAAAAILAALSVSPAASAQQIRYPEKVKAIFDEADAATTLSIRPVIGILAPYEAEAVVKAGGAPVVIPVESSVETLRSTVFSLDGIILGDGFVREDNPFSVLLYKVASDRNVPVFGSNSLTEEIDRGMFRMPSRIGTVGELVERAALYRRAKEIHGRIFTLDTHADLPDVYEDGYRLGRRADNQVNLAKMQEGMLDGTFLISYLGQKDFPDEESAVSYCTSQIEKIHADVEANSDNCVLVTTSEEAVSAKKAGKKCFFIGIENGFGIGKDIRNVRRYADMGVRYITLSHTYDNLICHTSSHSADTTLGLTAFGKKVVREMNRCGILVDCSHTSSGTFWDCIKYSKAPIICSHSGCKALFDHDRSITDDQLRALRDNGGVIQIYAVWNFQARKLDEADLDVYLDHIDHAVKVAGIDHVGIGVDMDGGGGYYGVFGCNDMLNITVGLLERGYSDSDLEKLWSGNFFRVLDAALAVARR